MPCDYKKYPPNWKEIRERILSRAGQVRNDEGIITEACCEWCNAPNHSLIVREGDSYRVVEGHAADAAVLDGEKVVQVILTIAHLDHDSENWQVKDDRLAALCQRCHNRYDKDFRRSNIINKRGNQTLF